MICIGIIIPSSVILSMIGLAMAECRDGWTYFQESCYIFGHEAVTFADADRYCSHFDAVLVNIQSSAENTFVQSFANALKANVFWIGVTDQAIEGLWRNYPSEELLTFSGWSPGEPDNHEDGNCVAIQQNLGYKWYDAGCDALFHAICEQPSERETSAHVG